MPLNKSRATPAHKASPQKTYRFEALGVPWEIVTFKPLKANTLDVLHRVVDEFDSLFSRFRPDSTVAEMARTAGTFSFPTYTLPLFELYESLYELTHGAVTPLIGSALEDCGYDATYSLKRKKLRSIPHYQEVVQRKGSVLTTKVPVVFDVGAAGKGFLVDHLAQLLEREGHTHFTVDGSGDIYQKGGEGEVIGLEFPGKEGEVVGQFPLHNAALCASSVFRRAWAEDMHHIVDAQTMLPTKKYGATWVKADTALLADGLATALFFVEPNVLQSRYTYEYARMNRDNTIEYSKGFMDAFYK